METPLGAQLPASGAPEPALGAEDPALSAEDPSVDGQSTPEGAAAKRRSVLFLAGSLAGGNLVAMVLRLVAGVLLGRLVAPATLGLFTGIGLVLGYAPALQLGVLNGLNRELPYFVGKGELDRVRQLASAAQAWALIVGSVVFLALTGISIWYLAAGDYWHAAGWFTNAIMAVMLFFSTYYLQMTFRTSHDFARLAIVNVVEVVAGLILLLAVAELDFYGLCIRLVLMTLIAGALLFFWRPIRVGPKWSFRHLKHLAIIGAPIFAVGLLFGWWGGVINSTLVLRFTGTRGMGLYSMVLLGTAALDIIPAAVGQVVYPRMAESYGRSSKIGELIPIARKPILFTIAALVPVIVAAWLLAEPLMRLVVPNYVEAAPAVRWAFLLALVSAFQPLNSLFNVVRRQDLYVIAILFGMAVYGGSLVLLTRGQVSLTAFPQALLIGRASYMVLSYVFIRYLRNRERAREHG